MAVGEWRSIFAADVRIEVFFMCEDLATVVVDGQCDGFADLITDAIVHRPVLEETCGIRCQLKASAYLEL